MVTPQKRRPNKVCFKIWLETYLEKMASDVFCSPVTKDCINSPAQKQLVFATEYCKWGQGIWVLPNFNYWVFATPDPIVELNGHNHNHTPDDVLSWSSIILFRDAPLTYLSYGLAGERIAAGMTVNIWIGINDETKKKILTG